MMDIAGRQTSGPSVGKFPAFLAGLIVFIIPCVHIGNVYIFLFLHLHDTCTCGVYPDVDQTQGDSACLICIFINPTVIKAPTVFVYNGFSPYLP